MNNKIVVGLILGFIVGVFYGVSAAYQSKITKYKNLMIYCTKLYNTKAKTNECIINAIPEILNSPVFESWR